MLTGKLYEFQCAIKDGALSLHLLNSSNKRFNFNTYNYNADSHKTNIRNSDFVTKPYRTPEVAC